MDRDPAPHPGLGRALALGLAPVRGRDDKPGQRLSRLQVAPPPAGPLPHPHPGQEQARPKHAPPLRDPRIRDERGHLGERVDGGVAPGRVCVGFRRQFPLRHVDGIGPQEPVRDRFAEQLPEVSVDVPHRARREPARLPDARLEPTHQRQSVPGLDVLQGHGAQPPPRRHLERQRVPPQPRPLVHPGRNPRRLAPLEPRRRVRRNRERALDRLGGPGRLHDLPLGHYLALDGAEDRAGFGLILSAGGVVPLLPGRVPVPDPPEARAATAADEPVPHRRTSTTAAGLSHSTQSTQSLRL